MNNGKVVQWSMKEGGLMCDGMNDSGNRGGRIEAIGTRGVLEV